MRRSLVVSLLAVLSALACSTTEDSPEEHDAAFYNNNAQRFYDGGHYRQALQQFERALEVDDDDDIALVGRAWCFLMLGETQTLRAEKDGPANIQIALELFQELSGTDYGEQQFKVDLGLGRAHAFLASLYEKRAFLVRREMELTPGREGRAEVMKQAEEKSREHFAEAERILGAVLSDSENPAAKDELTALLLLARLAVTRQDYAGALVYTSRYLEQVRKSKNLWLESIRRFPEDEALWEARLAGAVGKEVPARYVISNALYKLGKLAEAEAELSEVLLLDPELANAYLDRAILRESLGRAEEALGDYRKFLEDAAERGLTEDDLRVREAAAGAERAEKALYGSTKERR